MPIVESSYKPPLGFSNGHVQTIYAYALRWGNKVDYRRERITTVDHDFLDLDWLHAPTDKCVIISHGLEADSNAIYVRSMAKHLHANGFAVCAWNFRGCSGEPNKIFATYNCGEIHDLESVIQRAAKSYKEIYLVGFSLGGSTTIKYLGQKSGDTPTYIKGSVVFSVPTDLKACSITLERKRNSIYRDKFIRSLKRKLKLKSDRHPGTVSLKGLHKIRTLRQFDEAYSAPVLGFEDANDYYAKSSCGQDIPNIKSPTLIVNAKNDPFLPEACFPKQSCNTHPYVTLEIPHSGGHAGFVTPGKVYWSEQRALEFLQQL